MEKGHAKEAVTYVARCDSPKRPDLYVECGEWRMAGKECKERGDKAKLEYVSFSLDQLFLSSDDNSFAYRELRKKCPNSLITRELDQIASSMK